MRLKSNRALSTLIKIAIDISLRTLSYVSKLFQKADFFLEFLEKRHLTVLLDRDAIMFKKNLS